MIFKVLSNLNHDGRIYGIGDKIEIADKLGLGLVEDGILETIEVVPVKAEKKAEKKAKAKAKVEKEAEAKAVAEIKAKAKAKAEKGE